MSTIYIVQNTNGIIGLFSDEGRAKAFLAIANEPEREPAWLLVEGVDDRTADKEFVFRVAMRYDGSYAYADPILLEEEDSCSFSPIVFMDGWYDEDPEPTFECNIYAMTKAHAIAQGHDVRRELQASGKWDQLLAESSKYPCIAH